MHFLGFGFDHIMCSILLNSSIMLCETVWISYTLYIFDVVEYKRGYISGDGGGGNTLQLVIMF